MTIGYIILKVLAIIGIVILSIIALILLILLTVLLVPLRYSAQGSYSKDGEAPVLIARGSWLLHIVSVTYTYKTEEPLSIRLFGFRLFKKKKEKPEEIPSFESETSSKKDTADAQPETNNKKEVTAEIKAEEKPEVKKDEAPSEQVAIEQPIAADEPEDESSEEADMPEEKDETEGYSEDEPEEEDEEEEVDPTEKYSHKNKKHAKIKRYIEILRSDLFKEAFYDGKDILFKILKHVLPRKWNINADIGFDDPATTGSILAAAGMLYPIIGNHVNINGYFDREVISVNGKLKGHITLMRILILGLFAFFNRKIRRLIKLFKEA